MLGSPLLVAAAGLLSSPAASLSHAPSQSIVPYELLADQRCYCAFRSAFATDPDHFHSCAKFKRSVLTMRHDNIVQVLQDLAVSVGFNTVREPNSHVRPDAIAQLPASSIEYNHHADLLLLKHGLKIYVDVTITRPTNDSTVKVSAKTGASTIPLFSTRAAASGKHVKYDEIARVNEYSMVPFVMESYGGIGEEASKLLRTMSVHSVEYSPSDFLLHAHKRLSVALQSSNADVAQLAMQHFHLHQHAANKISYEAKRDIHWARTTKYAQAADGDQLAQHVSLAVQSAECQAQQRAADRMDESASAAGQLAFVHQRRVGVADIAHFAGQSDLVSLAA